jgi:hypothetical protein
MHSFLLILIASTATSALIADFVIIRTGVPYYTPEGITILKVFFCLSPSIVVILIGDALRRFKSCDCDYMQQYTVDSKQIAIQLVSNIMFAASEIVMYEIRIDQLTYYLYVVFNAIGLFVLLVTLMKIATVQ